MLDLLLPIVFLIGNYINPLFTITPPSKFNYFVGFFERVQAVSHFSRTMPECRDTLGCAEAVRTSQRFEISLGEQ